MTERSLVAPPVVPPCTAPFGCGPECAPALAAVVPTLVPCAAAVSAVALFEPACAVAEPFVDAEDWAVAAVFAAPVPLVGSAAALADA